MGELPRRKANRLAGYDYSQPRCYFVTICTKDRAHVLGRVVVGADVLIGPHVRLSQMGKIVDQILSQMPDVKKYIVTPDHVHLLIQIQAWGDGPMGTSAPTHSVPWVVRYFKRKVTLACGENVWQRGYHDHIIRTDADYLRVWDYMDTNPAKWREDCYYTGTEA